MAFGFSFSWRRALGVTSAKRKVSKAFGIPFTKSGRQRKVGAMILVLFKAPKPKRKTKRRR